MSSIKGNIILNGINTLTGIIVPIITFPYAARVLLPEGIGAVNFLNSIVGYIVLFTSLGIPLYAVKEVAKYRNDKIARDRITVEILILSSALCLFGYIAVWLLAEFVPQIHQQASLFYILSLTIVFTSIGANWFYQGIEDFKFITIRAVIIRILAAISLFIFVKDSSDLLIYGIITVFSTVGNNFINFIHLRKHLNIKLINLRDLNISRHIKPTLQVFILNLIVSLYIQLNSIMLGFMAGDEQVGYFTAGTRISHIGLTIISSLATVMLPRCSNLLSNGDENGFAHIIKKSLNLTLALSFPMTVGLMILATPITMIFCGDEYIPSIDVLYLNAPVVFFISLTNLMGIQILYPKDKTNIVITSVSGGAIANLVLNIIFIPYYGAIGAAISTLIAEFIVFLIQLIMGKQFYPFSIKAFFPRTYLIATVIMGVIVYLSIITIQSLVLQLIIGVLVGITVYFFTLILLKDRLALEILKIVKNKIKS